MKRAFVLVALVSVGALAFAEGAASKAGSLGIIGATNGNLTSFGVAYNVTDSIVIRPQVGLYYRITPEGAYEDSNAYDTDYFYGGIEVSGLYSLPVASTGLMIGVGPTVSYYFNKFSYTYTGSTDVKTHTYFGIGALANVQYLFAKSFGVFLDLSLGVQFQSGSYKTGLTGNSTDYKTIITWSNNPSVFGLIFYLK